MHHAHNFFRIQESGYDQFSYQYVHEALSAVSAYDSFSAKSRNSRED